MHEYEELEPFWKRYNKVLLDKVTLDKERQVLLQENGQLRSLLKQYLDGISVNEEILSKVSLKKVTRALLSDRGFVTMISLWLFLHFCVGHRHTNQEIPSGNSSLERILKKTQKFKIFSFIIHE